MDTLILPTGPIPVLTLYGCWAAAIAYALPIPGHPEPHAGGWLKDLENRPWPLPARLVGKPIAIHAGAYPWGPGSWSERSQEERVFRAMCEAALAAVPEEIPTREIAAVVVPGPTVDGDHPSPWRRRQDRYALPFAEVWRLPEAAPCDRGAQKIWYIHDGTLDARLRDLAGRARRVL